MFYVTESKAVLDRVDFGSPARLETNPDIGGVPFPAREGGHGPSGLANHGPGQGRPESDARQASANGRRSREREHHTV